MAHAGTAIIYIVGISFAIYETHPLRTVAKSLLAGAGILALAIGLASQHALSNIVSGLESTNALKSRIPYMELWRISHLRHVIIRDFENRRIIIPNSVISQEIIVNADIEDNRFANGWKYSSHIILTWILLSQ
ncbi:MAG: mechanosensitive ion channel [Saprospiraceae bacterium]|nr:mechanosensitive ion channel [Saprospiraceae bacterium]